MRFIKLTRWDDVTVYLAVSQIYAIFEEDGATRIAHGGGEDKDIYQVKESVEEIFTRLKDTYRKDFPDE